MSLMVAAIAAAGVGLAAGAVALGSWLRKRGRQTTAAAAADEPEPPAAQPVRDPAFSLTLGDMIQVEQQTRWLCSGFHVSDGITLRCALWYGADGADGSELVVAFPPPDRHIYWLTRSPVAVPEHSPSRLEIDSRLLDRVATYPAELEAFRPPQPADRIPATVSIYEGAIGDAAVAIHRRGACAVFAGTRLEDGDYDRLGTVDPDRDGAASTDGEPHEGS